MAYPTKTAPFHFSASRCLGVATLALLPATVAIAAWSLSLALERANESAAPSGAIPAASAGPIQANTDNIFVPSTFDATDVVPEELVVTHEGIRCMDQRGNGACVGLDPVTMLCTLYESRPKTCRDFNRGEALCRRILKQPRH